MQHPQILENGEQVDITPEQAEALVAAGIIYDSGDNYYHIVEGKTYKDVYAVTGSLKSPDTTLPDFRVVIQAKRHYSGKTLLMSVLNRALKDAGFTDVEVMHDDTPEYFERMTPEQLENVRNNTPEFFSKKIQLVEQPQRLSLIENGGAFDGVLAELHAKVKRGDKLNEHETQQVMDELVKLPLGQLERICGFTVKQG
jgi:hypothetical protein